MKSAYLRRAPLSMACILALQATLGYAQAVNPPTGTDPAPYEIPLSISTETDPVVDAHPKNALWVPVTPANPYPDQTYKWYRLNITLGLNGGQATTLIFDTGSVAFNIDGGLNYKNALWLKFQAGQAVSDGYAMYGDGSYGYHVAKTTMPSVQFYKLNDDLATSTRVAEFAPKDGIPVQINTDWIGSAQSLGPSGDPGDIVKYRLGERLGTID